MRRAARPGVTGGANAVSEAVRSSGLVMSPSLNFRTRPAGRVRAVGSGRSYPDATPKT